MSNNNKEAFTGGEWMARQGDMNEYEVFTKDMLIATVLAIDIPDEEGEANARLIAEAKNMYYALKTIADCSKEKTNYPLTKSDAKGFVKIAEAIINRINK